MISADPNSSASVPRPTTFLPSRSHTGRFRTIAMSPEIAREARESGRAPSYGHPTHREPAKGYGPCRLCLETFRVHEEDRLLFTYDPFAGLDEYPSPGPVFIHADGCEPFAEADGFPESLRALPLTLEGYGTGRWLVARERVTGGNVEGAAERLFAHSAVDY